SAELEAAYGKRLRYQDLVTDSYMPSRLTCSSRAMCASRAANRLQGSFHETSKTNRCRVRKQQSSWEVFTFGVDLGTRCLAGRLPSFSYAGSSASVAGQSSASTGPISRIAAAVSLSDRRSRPASPALHSEPHIWHFVPSSAVPKPSRSDAS